MAGNEPKFEDVDILRVFLSLRSEISRAELTKNTGLGEGSVRTILNLLKKRGLIESSKKGHRMTVKGKQLYAKITTQLSFKKNVKLSFTKKTNIALCIRKMSELSPHYSIRDIAVKAGADGAMILQYNNGFFLPECSDHIIRFLEKLFSFRYRDVLIVVWSDSLLSAERGAYKILNYIKPEIIELLTVG